MKLIRFVPWGLKNRFSAPFINMDKNLLNVPAFSLVDFIESLTELEVVGCEEGGGRLVPGSKNHLNKPTYEEKPRISKGETGSLDKIFLDLKVAFTKDEFVSILYTVMEIRRL